MTLSLTLAPSCSWIYTHTHRYTHTCSRSSHTPTHRTGACAALKILFLSAANRAAKNGESLAPILAALREHRGVAEVQIEGNGALWNLSLDDAGRQLVGTESGIPLILAGMKLHTTSAEVQEQAMGVVILLKSQFATECIHICINICVCTMTVELNF